MQRTHRTRLVPLHVYVFLTLVILSLVAKHAILLRLTSFAVFNEMDDTSPFNFSVGVRLEPKKQRGVEVLVLVSSMPQEHRLRQQIRSSWANLSKELSQTVRVEFVMGRGKTKETQRLHEEHRRHNDLVVLDFDDAYYELPLKTFAMLNYKAKKYLESKCLVKADIDNVLLLHNYQRLCEETVAPAILGKCDVPRGVFRNQSKWAVPQYVYPFSLYPPYCSTGTYLLVGAKLPKRLVESALSSQFSTSKNFRMLPEDVIFTGILSERIGVRRRHVGAMTFSEVPEFVCRNGFRHAYSIHMSRDKNHVKHHRKLLKVEGTPCGFF
ncbi:unnamed protein product [Caenorhabditis auriculariae]|uniref:Hexosyltransferase n=1 Tax=Caenorhabditis auriculariae TaxID=2777116 RepID=A0A8S1H9K7_9PELO|nr:unnamed protein product [Caenorhabditis auriculariae]